MSAESPAPGESDTPKETFRPWEGDHTDLVHVLWDARNKGLTLSAHGCDEVADMILASRWLQAREAHAVDHANTAQRAGALTVAYALASDTSKHDQTTATTIRNALKATQGTHSDEDGWLWADEALEEIEGGKTTAALWKKVADNLATLLPARDG